MRLFRLRKTRSYRGRESDAINPLILKNNDLTIREATQLCYSSKDKLWSPLDHLIFEIYAVFKTSQKIHPQ